MQKIKVIDPKKNKTPNQLFSWGTLTGKNPAQVSYALEAKGYRPLNLLYTIKKEHGVGEIAAEIIAQILESQKFVIRNSKMITLCVCFPQEERHDALSVYLNSLMREIIQAKKIIEDNAYLLQAVYIKTGALKLTDKELITLLSACAHSKLEFTFEVGDGKLLTLEKLDILRRFNVNRVMFEIGSFIPKTRGSTDLNSFLAIYKKCIAAGINTEINCIAGLGSETIRDFTNTLASVCELGAVSVGVLSPPKDIGKAKLLEVVRLVRAGYDFLLNKGYKPYSLEHKNYSGTYVDQIFYALPNGVNKFRTYETRGENSLISCGIGACSIKASHIAPPAEFCASGDLAEYNFNLDKLLKEKADFFS